MILFVADAPASNVNVPAPVMCELSDIPPELTISEPPVRVVETTKPLENTFNDPPEITVLVAEAPE